MLSGIMKGITDTVDTTKKKVAGVLSSANEDTKEASQEALDRAAQSQYKLGDTSSYFKPGASIQESANSVQDVSLWSKAKGAMSSVMGGGEKDIGKLYADVDFDDPENDELLGVIADTEQELEDNKEEEEGYDWAGLARTLQSIKGGEPYKMSNAPAFKAGWSGTGYKNPLLDREYAELYNQPLYSPLTKR